MAERKNITPPDRPNMTLTQGQENKLARIVKAGQRWQNAQATFDTNEITSQTLDEFVDAHQEWIRARITD